MIYIDLFLKTKTKNLFEKFENAILSKNNDEIENSVAYKALNQLLNASNKPFQRAVRKGEIFYRSRVINDSKLLDPKHGISKTDNGFTGLNAYQSKEPPLDVTPEGRNNIRGVSYLYLSKDKYTACVETCPHRGDLISLATFTTNKTLHLVDFVTNDSVTALKSLEEEYHFSAAKLVTLVMERLCAAKKDNNTYKFSQYLTDLIRKKGYDGIIYASLYNRKKNLTLFNSDDSFIKFEKSDLLFCSCNMPVDIYDLSTHKRLTPKCHRMTDVELNNVAEQVERDLKRGRESLKKN